MELFDQYFSIKQQMEQEEAVHQRKRNAKSDELHKVESAIKKWAKQALKGQVKEDGPVLIKTAKVWVAYSDDWLEKPIIIPLERIVDFTQTQSEHATD